MQITLRLCDGSVGGDLAEALAPAAAAGDPADPALPVAPAVRGPVVPVAKAAQRTKSRKQRAVCKVVQCEGFVSISFEILASKRHVILEMPLSCPLQLVDKNTAETTNAVGKEYLEVPLWLSISRLCEDGSSSAATCDRAASNLKSEAVNAENGNHLTLDCTQHNVSSVQQAVYTPIDDTIGGVVGLALSLRPSGNLPTLRDECVDVLAASCEVVAGPLPRDTLYTEHLDSLLRLCFSDKCPRDVKRRNELEKLIRPHTHPVHM